MTTFDDDDLAAQLDAMTDEQRHTLPFGVVGLSREGQVHFYSRAEATQSGYGDRPVRGLDFFRQVAPCMNKDEFWGRVQGASSSDPIDLEIGHTGDFSDPKRFLRARLMSAADGGFWLANQRS